MGGGISKSKLNDLKEYFNGESFYTYDYATNNYAPFRIKNSNVAKKAIEKYLEFYQKDQVQNLDGWFKLKAGSFIVNGGNSSQFLKGDGSLDSTVYFSKHEAEDILTELKTIKNQIKNLENDIEDISRKIW